MEIGKLSPDTIMQKIAGTGELLQESIAEHALYRKNDLNRNLVSDW